MDRRELFRRVARAIALAMAGSLLPKCTDDDQTDRSYTSSVTSGHSHNLLIAGTLLNSPPAAGWTGTTSAAADSHTHEIDLTQLQLQNIAIHQVFSEDTLDEEAHNHTFNFT